MMVGSLSAQELEDDFINIRKSEDTIVSEDFDLPDEEVAVDVNSTPKPRLVSVESSVVVQKKEQLGIVARKALYQKLTTPRWVSIISADTWKQSFIKWRYYAQLRNHIVDIDNDLTYLLEKEETISEPIAFVPPTVAIEKEGATKDEEIEDHADNPTLTEEESPVKEETSLEETKDFLIVEKKLDVEEAEISSKVAKDVSQEPEAWEEDDGSYSFSLDELTLPDSVLSEREIWLKEEEDRLYRDSVLLALSDDVLKEQPDEATEEKTAPPQEEKVEITSEPKKEENPPVVVSVKKKEIKKESTTQQISTPEPVETKSETIASVVSPKPNNELEKEAKQNSTTPISRPPSARITGRRKAQTAAFERKKGKLAWPIMSGSISSGYGITRKSKAGGIQVRNNGIDFSCPPRSSILSVHSGTVLMVSLQAGYSNVVTVKHGDYTTAYYHLGEVNVKVGDVVAIGQRLGRLKSGAAEVPFHFEIWKDQDKVNPEMWLGSR